MRPEQVTAFQAALAAFQTAGGDMGSFQNATGIGQDRLIRKEVELGRIREIEPPMEHVGVAQFAPMLSVATDDVVFEYVTVQTDGLAPARAEDAEAELAQKDDTGLGEGRASVIDWAHKDHYDPSDVNRYREINRILEGMKGQGGSLPLFASSALEDFAGKVTRDTNRRLRKLQNRLEKNVMDALSTGQISYNDGKIKFLVDYGRPAAQQGSNAANDRASAGITDGIADWSSFTHDPIKMYLAIDDFMYQTYGVHMDRVLGSRKAFNTIINSDKFAQRAGLGPAFTGANVQVGPDPRYLIDGWGPQAARQVVERATGITHIEYDSVYRTRAIGSNTIVSTRFFPQNRLLFLPSITDLGQVDETQIGFGKTLTSPHPEGNWQSGYYEWERSTVDPWGQDKGTGIKAFPVFPFMEYTYVVDLVLPA